MGDDCAVVRFHEGTRQLLTSDISIEGVHFDQRYCEPFDIGWKAMMANISDIAAMGGMPLFALVSLGLTRNVSEEYVMELYRGMCAAAFDARAQVVGGDISRSETLVVSIAMYGEVEEGKTIYRNGAQAGEYLYVTGTLGGSLAGLELLQRGIVDPQYSALYNKHKRPTARHAIVSDIIAQFSPTSMIDISDGLISDLRHLCEESHVGVCIFGDDIPFCDGLYEYAKRCGKEPLEYALKSGEEYELLFTSKKWLADTIHLYINDVSIKLIGEIRKTGMLVRVNGVETKLEGFGYDHFAQE
ncbi:MAG: thiamine-phosphate kinase [Spirochaetes bacterium]|nr:thiamine-phosphate kinase [Spirochaetota bacterium]